MLQSEIAKAIFGLFEKEKVRSPKLYMNINIEGDRSALGGDSTELVQS